MRRGSTGTRDLGDVAVELIPSLAFRTRAWELRDNFTVGDALFVALAEQLGERLITRDARLASAARRHTEIDVTVLEGSR